MAGIMSVFGRLNGADLEFVDQATGTVVFAFRQSLSSQPVVSAADGLTAHAGGGQANALALTAGINRVKICATTADSVLLPASTAGAVVYVCNAGAQTCAVFPQTGDQINAAGANSSFSVATNKNAVFVCSAAGQWSAVLTA